MSKAKTLGKMYSRRNPKFTRENRFNDWLRNREPAGKIKFIEDKLKPKKKKRKAKKPVTWNYD